MTAVSGPELAFAVAAAAHLGFQGTVTLLVYPALADAAEVLDADAWQRTHDRHSRRIAPVVGVLYGALLVAGVSVLLRDLSVASVVGVFGALLAIGVTAAFAAPLHSRLTAAGGRADLPAVRRLLRVDRLRLVGAVIGLAGGVVAGL